jgi:hypothetical protein
MGYTFETFADDVKHTVEMHNKKNSVLKVLCQTNKNSTSGTAGSTELGLVRLYVAVHSQ